MFASSQKLPIRSKQNSHRCEKKGPYRAGGSGFRLQSQGPDVHPSIIGGGCWRDVRKPGTPLSLAWQLPSVWPERTTATPLRVLPLPAGARTAKVWISYGASICPNLLLLSCPSCHFSRMLPPTGIASRRWATLAAPPKRVPHSILETRIDVGCPPLRRPSSASALVARLLALCETRPSAASSCKPQYRKLRGGATSPRLQS